MKFVNAHEALELLLNKNEELKLSEINISSKALKNEEAIGCPDRDDFPLLRGKEVLLQAEVDGSIGQAFTSDPIAYRGKIKDLLDLSDERLGNYALLVASVNAVGHKLGIADHTVHCKNNEPEECAKKISKYILEKHGMCNIGIIGYQPAILENCVSIFGSDRINLSDLSQSNIGSFRFGVKVLDGFADTKKLIEFSDVLLITGSILANGTYKNILNEIGNKPYYLFGTTCSALASINNIDRLCPMSK